MKAFTVLLALAAVASASVVDKRQADDAATSTTSSQTGVASSKSVTTATTTASAAASTVSGDPGTSCTSDSDCRTSGVCTEVNGPSRPGICQSNPGGPCRAGQGSTDCVDNGFCLPGGGAQLCLTCLFLTGSAAGPMDTTTPGVCSAQDGSPCQQDSDCLSQDCFYGQGMGGGICASSSSSSSSSSMSSSHSSTSSKPFSSSSSTSTSSKPVGPTSPPNSGANSIKAGAGLLALVAAVALL